MIRKKPDRDYFIRYRATIGTAIREHREKLGYSQEILAEKMNVQRSTISKIENGKFSISVAYLAKFAWFLKLKISLIEVKKSKI